MKTLFEDFINRNEEFSMVNSNREINTELKKIFDEWMSAYTAFANESFDERARTVRPGEYVQPKSGRIEGEYYRGLFEKKCEDLRIQANALIMDSLNRIHSAVAEAPSAEAVNTVALLKLRDDVTSEEYSDILSRYGSNYQVYKTVASMAAAHNIKFPPSELEYQQAYIEALAKDIAGISLQGAEQADFAHGYGKGLVSMYKLAVNRAFPFEGMEDQLTDSERMGFLGAFGN